MRSRIAGTIALMAVLAPAALAWSPFRAPLSIQPESRLWVVGTSTARSYQCRATRIEGTVATDPATAGTAIADLQRVVKRVEISVPTALECGNGTMNEHLRRALQSAANPVIRYRLSSHEVTPRGENAGSVRMSGRLSIAGQEKPVGIDATLERQASGALRVKGSTQLRMTDFGVRPPTLMMGTMRVHDPVKVHFDVVLKP